jgi:hypothetical protein
MEDSSASSSLASWKQRVDVEVSKTGGRVQNSKKVHDRSAPFWAYTAANSCIPVFTRQESRRLCTTRIRTSALLMHTTGVRDASPVHDRIRQHISARERISDRRSVFQLRRYSQHPGTHPDSLCRPPTHGRALKRVFRHTGLARHLFISAPGVHRTRSVRSAPVSRP